MPSTSTDRRNGLTTSVAIKAPCRVATVANITLFGEQTVNGVAVVEGDRVLVMEQTDSVDNGIYVVSESAWARSKDFNGNLDAVQGTVVLVRPAAEGTLFYELQTANPVVIGESEIEFAAADPGIETLKTQLSSESDSTLGAAMLGIDFAATDLRDFLHHIFGRTAAEIAAGVTPTNYFYSPGNPQRFGAVGDDATDNATAFANWAAVPGNKYLPEGVFRYTATPVFSNGKHKIVGAGRGSAVLKPVGYIDALRVSDGYPVANSILYDIEVEGITFDCSLQLAGSSLVPAGAFTPGQHYNIVTVGTTDYTLIGAPSNTVGMSFLATGAGSGTGTAYLHNDTYGNGVNLNAVDRFDIHGNEFIDVKNQVCVSTYYALSGVLQKASFMRHNIVRGVKMGQICFGIEGIGSNVTVAENIVNDSYGIGVRNDNVGGGGTNGRCPILGNHLNGFSGYATGIYISDYAFDVDIKNNTIKGFDLSIRCSSGAASTRGFSIVGNTCLEWVSGGILTFPMNGSDSTEALIASNRIKSSVASGSSNAVIAGKGAAVHGNFIFSGATGIACSGSGQSIFGNTIKGPTLSIDASAATGVVIGPNDLDTTPDLNTDTLRDFGQGMTAAVASATSITLPVQGNVVPITGTTTIDTISTTNQNGRIVTLLTSSSTPFGTGGNLRLGGSMTRDADDALQVVCHEADNEWRRIASAAN